MNKLKIIVILSFFMLVACVSKNEKERDQWRSVKKEGYLQILWQDGIEETYKGKFRDYPEKIKLIKGAKYIKMDTMLTFWSEDSVLTDTGYVYIDKIVPQFIMALPTNFIKAQIKQYYITWDIPPELWGAR